MRAYLDPDLIIVEQGPEGPNKMDSSPQQCYCKNTGFFVFCKSSIKIFAYVSRHNNI